MRKTETFILILLASLMPLFSMSISGTELDNPFPSGENLEKFSFSGDSEDLSDWQINLVSTRTGGPVYSWFGHTSIEIVPPHGSEFFYDYGYFTFSEGFYLNFALGRLYYNMYGTYADWRLMSFQSEDRTVWRTPLPLDDAAKRGVMEFLHYNEKPENSTYLYHYFNDNCATRVRDIIDAATEGEFRKWAEGIDTGMSLRSTASAYLDKIPPVSFAINYLLGPTTDRTITLWDAMYLPEALEWAVENFFSVDSEIVYESSARRDHRTMPLTAFSLVAGMTASVMLTAAAALDRKKLYRILEVLSGILYTIFGVMSTVLLFMMLFTNHDVTYFNENLLYISPAIFIMGFEALRGRKSRKRYWISVFHGGAAVTALILKLVVPGLFFQYNIPVLLMMIPLYASEIVRERIRERRSAADAVI